MSKQPADDACAKPETAKPRGRTRLLDKPETQEKVERLLSALRGGNFREVACEWAGIPERTFRAWMDEGEAGAPESSVAFCRQVIEAEKAAEIHCVELVMREAEQDPKHAEWWLERKHPDRWGRKDRLQAEHTGANGGPVLFEVVIGGAPDATEGDDGTAAAEATDTV